MAAIVVRVVFSLILFCCCQGVAFYTKLVPTECRASSLLVCYAEVPPNLYKVSVFISMHKIKAEKYLSHVPFACFSVGISGQEGKRTNW